MTRSKARGHKSKGSHISPPFSEMTILSEVMKDAWEQSSVIFTSSCGPEEQTRLNQSEAHQLLILALTVKSLCGGRKWSQVNLLKGKAVVPLVWLLRDTPNGGTLWFRYSNEFTANTTTPPEHKTHNIILQTAWRDGCWDAFKSSTHAEHLLTWCPSLSG